MAEVWRARADFEAGGSHMVAIKRVRPNIKDAIFRSMFEDEARLGMKLRHDNIVRVYDARDVAGAYIMIMELVEGDSLRGLLTQAHARGACMPVPAALHITREVAKALAYVHHLEENGRSMEIIHRDVSPHNVLLGRDGGVKLTDFGLADAIVHETVNGAEMVGGKFGYLAPEIINQERGDHRVDLFGLGVLVWEMLAGRRLFHGETDAETVQQVARCDIPSLRHINYRVSREADDLIASLLARDPAERLSDARELVTQLDALIDHIDGEVGPKDVSLLMGLHLAKRESSPDVELGGLKALENELMLFVDAALSEGAEPLDPNMFSFIPPPVNTHDASELSLSVEIALDDDDDDGFDLVFDDDPLNQ